MPYGLPSATGLRGGIRKFSGVERFHATRMIALDPTKLLEFVDKDSSQSGERQAELELGEAVSGESE